MTSLSSRTTRTRLTGKFDVVGIKSKSEFTNEQINKWIAEHAKAEMAKGGEYEDLRVKAPDVSSFKQANLCILL